MNTRTRSLLILAAGWLAGSVAVGPAVAAPAPEKKPPEKKPARKKPAEPVRYRLESVKDVDGNAVEVPQADRPTLLLFVMTQQAQSRKAVEQVAAALAAKPKVQVVTVLSGKEVAAEAKALKGKLPGSILIDTNYVIADRLSVMAWPTTVLILPSGEKAGHLAGLSKSFAKDLGCHLDFATGKIDRKTLAKRLAASDVIQDSPGRMAHRHLEVANRQLAKGLLEEARAEIERGLKLAPADAELRLAMARILLLRGKPDQALAMVNTVSRAAVPPWRIDSLRGRALVDLKQWKQAAEVLARAVALNPNPAESYYALGLLYQHQGEWEKAAKAFRSAVESTPTGRMLKPPPAPAAVRSTAAPKAR